MKFNPTIKEFMENDRTILALWWAMYWRVMVIMLLVGLSVVLVAMAIEVLSK